MNSFGHLFRVHIFGESHGACVGITIDGCPAGLPLQESDFIEDTERRKGGVQKGTTPRKEDDLPIFKSGIFKFACVMIGVILSSHFAFKTSSPGKTPSAITSLSPS
jgi:chorismate synthase